MPKREKPEGWEKVKIKREGRKSFSIPKKIRSESHRNCKTITRPLLSPVKSNKAFRGRPANEMDARSSTSTKSSETVIEQEDDSILEMLESIIDAGSSQLDEDGWESDSSVEKMRSGELRGLDDSVILPSLSIREKDLVSVVFPHHDSGPLYSSTPLNLPDDKKIPVSEPLNIPKVSLVHEFLQESVTLQGEDLRCKSISPEEIVPLPDMPDLVNYDNQEEKEGSFASPEVPDEKVCDDDDCNATGKEDNECNKSRSFGANVVNEPTISSSRNRKKENKKLNLLGNKGDYSNGENSEKSWYTLVVSSKKCNTSGEEDDDCSPFANTVMNKSTSSSSRNRKPENKIEKSLKNKDNHNNGENTKEARYTLVKSSKKCNASGEEDVEYNASDEDNDDCNKIVPLADTVINKSTNSRSRNRKQENKVENSLGDKYDNSNRENTEQALNSQVESSKEKEKRYGSFSRINDSILKWRQKKSKNLLEYKSDSDDNLENDKKSTNKEFQSYEFSNKQPKTVRLRINRKVKIYSGCDTQEHKDAIALNRSLHSTSLRRIHEDAEKSLFEDVGRSDRLENFEKVENIHNEEFKKQELENDQMVTVTHKRKVNKQVKFASFPSRSSNICQTEKRSNKIIKLSENLNNGDTPDDFDDPETPKRKGTPHRRVKLNLSHCMKTPVIRNHERVHLYESLSKDDSEDSLQNVQDKQTEELQADEFDNNQPETAAHHIDRKKKKHARADNLKEQEAIISNTSQSSTSLGRKQNNERDNLFEFMDKSDNEENFEKVQKNESNRNNGGNFSVDNTKIGDNVEESQNMKIIASKKKRRQNNEERQSNEGEISFELNDKTGSENFENVQNDQSDIDSGGNTSIDNNKISDNFENDALKKKRRKNNDKTQNNGEKDSLDLMGVSDHEGNFENVHKIQSGSDRGGKFSVDNKKIGDNFEEAKNMENDSIKKKRRLYKGVGVKRNINFKRSQKASNSSSKSKKASNSLNRSKKTDKSKDRSESSIGRDITEEVNNNQFYARKTRWPRCCIEESASLHSGQTFTILQPIFRDFKTIDTLTMVDYGIESKRKCKH